DDLTVRPLADDPAPSPIGLFQTHPSVEALRVRRPSVRRSWLERGPGANPERRGSDPFVEVPWDEAVDLVAAELKRVIAAHGNEAVFGG
ncbi:molybdopterin-dependent oxidoreductase, partial [Acinetobacter baumannii]